MNSPSNIQADRGSHLLAAVVSILVIETIFFGLRVASRASKRIPVGADDVFLFIGYPIIVGLDVSLIVMVARGGAGRHVQAIMATDGPGPITTFLKLQVAVAELYFLAVAFPKLSILSLYLRIFVKRPYRIMCRLLQVVMVLYPLAWFVAMLTVCKPISALWALEPPPGAHCGNVGNLERYVSVLNIVTDVIMILLPIGMIWEVQLPFKAKVGMVATLA